MLSRHVTVAGLAAAGMLAVGLFTPTAAAQTDEAAPAARPPSSSSYCTMKLTTGKTQCFDSKAELRRARTGLPIIVLYGQPKRGGKYFSITTKTGECPGRRSTVPKLSDLRKVHIHLPRGNWNNRISSTDAFHGCKVKLYAKRHWKGHRTKWLGHVERLGRIPDPGDNWNNAATSLAIK
ncbi:MAG: hypothetical protein ACRDQA_30100 [Nocardioidaceae bacterium]